MTNILIDSIIVLLIFLLGYVMCYAFHIWIPAGKIRQAARQKKNLPIYKTYRNDFSTQLGSAVGPEITKPDEQKHEYKIQRNLVEKDDELSFLKK